MAKYRVPIGFALLLLALCPTYNVGLAAYAIPFNADVTFYAYGRGDSCVDSLGKPPWFGLYGKCAGWVTDRQIAATGWKELEEAYKTETGATIDGPSYFAGVDSRATGRSSAAGQRPTDAVVTVGITGFDRVAERPAGWNLALGIIAPLLLVAGFIMVLLRRPQRL